MLNGFEFGLFALVAFAFVHTIWVIADSLDTPPVGGRIEEEVQADWQEVEMGVPIEGAKLISPTIKKETRVG